MTADNPKQGASDKQWAPEEKYMLFIRGFHDGTRGRDPRHADAVPYMEGYNTGLTAAVKATVDYCTKIGFTPSVLR